jgi:group I intron endonuclease
MIDWSDFKKESGIYCFKNLTNGKCYVGQAVNIKNRMRAHMTAIRSNKLGGLLLYKAIDKYGIDNFEISILETIPNNTEDLKSTLDVLEKKYIQELNSYAPNGYNMTLGGDSGVLGLKMTEEQKKKISIAATEQAEETRKPVYIWDFVNKKEYMSMSVMSAGDNPYIPLSRGSIQLLINNKKQIIKGCTAAESEEDLFKKRDQIIKDNIPITDNCG